MSDSRHSAAPAPPVVRSRGRRALRASIFEMTGFGGSQVVRLGGNLILTRLLFPEAFGLAALVSIVLQGLELLSDVGFSQAVVQNRRGDDPTFYNTAWSMQIIRGGILFAVCGVIAVPFSMFYEEPILSGLLAVAAVQVLLQGFQSTAIFTLRRRVQVGALTLLDLGGQVLSVAVMIGWAQFDRSVWALIAGGVARVVFRVIASHLLPVGYRNRWGIDPECRRQILGFGGWILGSTALLFLSRQADRLMVGKLLGVAILGVYSIAVMLAEVMDLVATRIAGNVFFPIFSEVGKEGVDELRRIYYQARLHLDAVFVTSLGALTMLGGVIVDVLWDARYADAAWMFEVLCCRVAMNVIVYPCDRCLLAMGESRFPFYRSAARFLWVVVAVPVGYMHAGIEGVIGAAALAEIPVFFVLWPAFHRRGMLRLSRELLAFAFFLVGIGIGSFLEPLLRAWIPS